MTIGVVMSPLETIVRVIVSPTLAKLGIALSEAIVSVVKVITPSFLNEAAYVKFALSSHSNSSKSEIVPLILTG